MGVVFLIVCCVAGAIAGWVLYKKKFKGRGCSCDLDFCRCSCKWRCKRRNKSKVVFHQHATSSTGPYSEKEREANMDREEMSEELKRLEYPSSLREDLPDVDSDMQEYKWSTTV